MVKVKIKNKSNQKPDTRDDVSIMKLGYMENSSKPYITMEEDENGNPVGNSGENFETWIEAAEYLANIKRNEGAKIEVSDGIPLISRKDLAESGIASTNNKAYNLINAAIKNSPNKRVYISDVIKLLVKANASRGDKESVGLEEGPNTVGKNLVSRNWRNFRLGGGANPIPDMIDFSFKLPNGKIESLNDVFDDMMNPVKHGKIHKINDKDNKYLTVPGENDKVRFAKNVGDSSITDRYLKNAENSFEDELTFGGILRSRRTPMGGKFWESKNNVPSLYELLEEGSNLDLREEEFVSCINDVFSKCTASETADFVYNMIRIIADNMNTIRGVDGYQIVCQRFFGDLIPFSKRNALANITTERPRGFIKNPSPGQKTAVHKMYSEQEALGIIQTIASRSVLFDEKEKLIDAVRNIVYYHMGGNGHNSYTIELIKKIIKQVRAEANNAIANSSDQGQDRPV